MVKFTAVILMFASSVQEHVEAASHLSTTEVPAGTGTGRRRQAESSAQPVQPSRDGRPPVEGKCLEAHCRAERARISASPMMLDALRAPNSPDVPSCCYSRMFSQQQDERCTQTPTTTAAPTSCMGDATSLRAGLRLDLRCTPPDLNMRVQCEYTTCSAPCSMQVVASNASSYYPEGIVSKSDGSPFTSADSFPELVTEQNLQTANDLYVLRMTCSSLMQSFPVQSGSCPADVGPIICAEGNRAVYYEMAFADGNQSALQRSGECDFGLPEYEGSDTCGMLAVDPSKVAYFLCGKTQINGRQYYCGDWVSKQDGTCLESGFETCTVANGPVKISEAECANNVFLQKLVRGSDENPYCGPLLRGGCCVSSMFHALTDDDENSMWPLCVRTWATSTCGVDLSTTCTNDEIMLTLSVEVTITIKMERRLSTTSGSCTDHEAKVLSRRIGSALAKSSAEAREASAKSVVISDSTCMNNTADQVIVTDLVVHGDNAVARQRAVVAAASSPDFSLHLLEEGVQVASIRVRGAAAMNTTDSTSNGYNSAAFSILAASALAFF